MGRGWLLNKSCGAIVAPFPHDGVHAEMRLGITRGR